MMAYLAMMAVRLIELHRVLKPTGSLYLHCDPTASHYLKMLLDAVFGATNFRNEISLATAECPQRCGTRAKAPGHVRDIIFFYTKSKDVDLALRSIRPYDESYVQKNYRHVEEGTGVAIAWAT